MEMITKKLIENSGKGDLGLNDNNKNKGGISLWDKDQQNPSGDNCCSFSL